MDFDVAQVEFGVAVALVVGIVEGLKRWLDMDTRYAFPVAVLLGQLLSVGYYVSARTGYDDLFGVVVRGLVVALSACGLYSGLKKAMEGGQNG